jgi:hypothetical protein
VRAASERRHDHCQRHTSARKSPASGSRSHVKAKEKVIVGGLLGAPKRLRDAIAHAQTLVRKRVTGVAKTRVFGGSHGGKPSHSCGASVLIGSRCLISFIGYWVPTKPQGASGLTKALTVRGAEVQRKVTRRKLVVAGAVDVFFL